jgi:hypothetical protein
MLVAYVVTFGGDQAILHLPTAPASNARWTDMQAARPGTPGPEHSVGARRAPQASTKELRLDLAESVHDCKHSQILASTSDSSRVGGHGGNRQLVLRMVEHRASFSQASPPRR